MENIRKEIDKINRELALKKAKLAASMQEYIDKTDYNSEKNKRVREELKEFKESNGYDNIVEKVAKREIASLREQNDANKDFRDFMKSDKYKKINLIANEDRIEFGGIRDFEDPTKINPDWKFLANVRKSNIPVVRKLLTQYNIPLETYEEAIKKYRI